MQTETRVLALALSIVLVSITAHAGETTRVGDPPARPDIILISIDTLRADALGSYGYGRATSPRLDALASRAFVFERAYTHSPNTITAHASLLTSLHPVTHGVRSDQPLVEGFTTLAELLRDDGYVTAGFATHRDWLNDEKGFAQGFDHFESRYQDADTNNQKIHEWLASRQYRDAEGNRIPLFLFVHYYDVHSDFGRLPYETKTEFDFRFVENYAGEFEDCRGDECGSKFLAKKDISLLSEEQIELIRALYDGGVAYTDDRIGDFLDQLRAFGLFDSSWIVVTSDHGEEFGEHGRMLHSQPYKETARVPLIVKPPGPGTGRSIAQAVGLVDVMPTLLELAGLEGGPPLQGRSFLPLLEGKPQEDRPVFFHEYARPGNVTVRLGDLTLVARKQFSKLELYDTGKDRAEKKNVAARRKKAARHLTGLARDFHLAQLEHRQAIETEPQEISEEELERLRNLGYVN